MPQPFTSLAPSTATCPTCGNVIEAIRTTAVAVDVDLYDDDHHVGHVCPLIRLRDRGRLDNDGRIEWITVGEVAAATSEDLTLSDEDVPLPSHGARRADGHSAEVLGDEVELRCPGCGWTSTSPIEPGHAADLRLLSSANRGEEEC